MATEPLYGLLAEFESLEALIDASRRVRENGYQRVDAFSPFPSEDLQEAIGHHHNALAKFVFCGGMTGAITGFSMQTIASVYHYPWDVGGKPYFSWPAFIPITYELMILFSALTAVFGMILMNGLPRVHHPLFNVKAFEKASTDGFFLLVESRDRQFDLGRTRALLSELKARDVFEVPA